MKVLDSNIVIYAALPAHEWLRLEILAEPFAVSQATRIEVLGWHRITPEDQQDLEEFLAAGTLHSLTDAVADRAVLLRQRKKMSLGDSLVAAAALVHDSELVTRNTDDFAHIPGLRVRNPFEK